MPTKNILAQSIHAANAAQELASREETPTLLIKNEDVVTPATVSANQLPQPDYRDRIAISLGIDNSTKEPSPKGRNIQRRSDSLRAYQKLQEPTPRVEPKARDREQKGFEK